MKKLFTLAAVLSVLLLIPDLSNAQQTGDRAFRSKLKRGLQKGEITREEARDLKQDRRNVFKIHRNASKNGLSRKERANLRRERQMTTNAFKSNKRKVNVDRYNRRYNSKFEKYSSRNFQRPSRALGW